MAAIYGFDAYMPKEVAERVENVGVTKARLPLLSMVALGIIAGGFIAFGAIFSTMVSSDPALPFPVNRLLAGSTFSLGLFLVVVAGAELFTGNNLLVMAWASGRISTVEVIKNWVIIYFANMVGAVGLAIIVLLANHAAFGGGAVGVNAVKIAESKAAMPIVEAFFKGILCNVLVCLGVWLAMAGRGVIDKFIAVYFPITAFVALGFEHSVANMYFIPFGIMVKAFGNVVGTVNLSSVAMDHLTMAGLVNNLVPVTIGNIVGGSLMVGLFYYIIYRRGARQEAVDTALAEAKRQAAASTEVSPAE